MFLSLGSKPQRRPRRKNIVDSGATGLALLQSATPAIAKFALAQATSAQATDYTLLTTDRGKHLSLTGDAKTLSFPTAASAGDGFEFSFSNDGTGVWLFDPNGAETIDTLPTMHIYPGETGTVRGDGTAWKTRGLGTGWVLLETRVLSAVASSDFNRFDTGRFGSFRFEFIELIVDTVAVNFSARVSASGSFITSSNYNYALLYQVAGTVGGTVNLADTAYLMKGGLDTARAASGWFEMSTLFNSWGSFSHFIGGVDNTPNGYVMTGSGSCHSGGTFDGVRFLTGSGTMSCTIRAYGKKK